MQTDPVRRLISLPMLDLVVGNWVLGVPDIVGDELFNLVLPCTFQIVVVHILYLVHKALHILDQDIISSDKHALLGATTSAA